MSAFPFPEDFVWGTATASYQIEGAAKEDGRSESIWDTFSRIPGKVMNGDNGDVACDHYHKLDEDLDLIKNLGVKSYRFSVAWPRVIPGGTGTVNEKGLDFYDRLIDGLLKRGILPNMTCYHWDLPQVLEDRGGWRARESADWFADYVEVLAKKFGDRVNFWATFNEPWCTWELGYRSGYHAPGAREDEKTSRNVWHHLMLAHGKAIQVLRTNTTNNPKCGIVMNHLPTSPFSEDAEDIEFAKEGFAKLNDWLFMPISKGAYPDWQLKELGNNIPDIEDGDLKIISQPIDFVGINYYAVREIFRKSDNSIMPTEPHFPRTDMGWNIVPDGIYWTIRFSHELYPIKEMYITENGACYPDQVNEHGKVEDLARIRYLQNHLEAVHRAHREGYPINGYYLWSLLDNFEWAEGYRKRFGIVFCHYGTGTRIPKASYEWYRRLIKRGGL